MSIKLPEVIQKSWRHYLLSLQFQSLHANVIARHTQTIQQICQTPDDPIYATLNDPNFWENLKNEHVFDPPLLRLDKMWQEIGPLIHLNTKQLLILLEEEIVPLENAYHLLEKELEGFSGKEDGINGKWILRLNQSKKDIQNKIDENNALLAKLKKIVYDSLLFRAQVHQFLQKPRNVDDALTAFCRELNPFLSQPFKLSQNFSETLNDDRRLAIYDILAQADYDKALIYQEVRHPIPARTHIALSTRTDVTKNLNDIKRFCYGILHDLDLRGLGSHAIFSTSPLFWGKSFIKKAEESLHKWDFLQYALLNL